MDYLGVTWKPVTERIQADVHKYVNMFEPIAMPTTDDSQRKLPFADNSLRSDVQ